MRAFFFLYFYFLFFSILQKTKKKVSLNLELQLPYKGRTTCQCRGFTAEFREVDLAPPATYRTFFLSAIPSIDIKLLDIARVKLGKQFMVSVYVGVFLLLSW